MAKLAKGIGLLSGGLDSALACLLLRDAGADVECLHFVTGFCPPGQGNKLDRANRPTVDHALNVGSEIGVPVEVVDIAEEYLAMVFKPRHGYGRNMNPCMDCRVIMLKKARERMEKTGGDFVFTGEVIGQRPKSQVKGALRVIEKDAGLEGRLLRPLSAALLPATEVELRGLVDRSRLCRISGRGRRTQIDLAARYGLTAYMQPGGVCCFLTDKAYSAKLRDAIKHQGADSLTLDDVFVLGVGRHFRLSPVLRVVVGRNAAENDVLATRATGRWLAGALGFTGPRAIVLGDVSGDEWAAVASIVARYCDGRDQDVVEVEFVRGESVRRVAAAPASSEFIEAHRI